MLSERLQTTLFNVVLTIMGNIAQIKILYNFGREASDIIASEKSCAMLS